MDLLKKLMIFLTFGQQSILTITTLMAQFMLLQDYRVKKYKVIEKILERKKAQRGRTRRLLAVRKARKPRSIWVANGRTDKWWENMIGQSVPNHIWMKNIRMSREAFLSPALEIHKTSFHLIQPP